MDFTITQNIYYFVGRWPGLLFLAKLLAVWLVYLVPLTLILLWFYPGQNNKKNALQAFLMAVFSWFVLASFFSFWLPRSRPDLPGVGVFDPLFHRPSTAFPSEHSIVLFSLAFYFFLVKYKKLGWLFLLAAIFVGLSRIAVGLHYFADVAIAIPLGLFAAVLFWLLGDLLNRLLSPIIKLAIKLKL